MKNVFRILGEKVELDIWVKGKTMKTSIDLVDLEKVKQFKWFGFVDNRSGKIYVMANHNKTTILLHRVIMGLENEKGFVVDHLNHNTLDNTRANLKATSFKRNASRKLEGISQVKKVGKRWGVFVNGKLYGEYETKTDAQVMSVVANMEHFPHLEEFHCWDTVLWRLGFDYASIPVIYKENGERDFSKVSPKTIRKIEKEMGGSKL